MLQADYGWLFARIARMPETRSTTLAHLPAGTYATSTRASRQGLSCKGGRFHASDDYVYYELGRETSPMFFDRRYRFAFEVFGPLLLIVVLASGLKGQGLPSLPHIIPNACQLECCRLGEWTTTFSTLAIHAQPGDLSPPLSTIPVRTSFGGLERRGCAAARRCRR